MAQKLKLTRPELKRQRDVLTRFERYLPMLKLKQQQLQLTIQKVARDRRIEQEALESALRKFQSYEKVMLDISGVNIRELAQYKEIKTSVTSIAGVSIPVFDSAVFPQASYSLFATPAWVDAALADLREVSKRRARLDVLRQQHALLQKELLKIIQRVNLFEKVKIPEARENIRRIRIQLGDEMASAVGRAKIAKGKLTEAAQQAG
ncbi:MAG: V-type ATP synthase subunit D [Dehalococcoidia bacterium]